VEGEVEVVAFPAEVGQEHLLEGVAGDFRQQRRGGLVGQVPLPAEDALLERPRAEGTVDEHFVVVGLEHEGLAAAQAFAGELRGHAEVGGDAEARRAAGQDETDRRVGVVRQGERQDLDVADREGAAVREAIPRQAGAALHAARGVAVGEERHAELLVELDEAGDVVGMLVRHADGAQLGGIEPRRRQAAQGFPRGKPRVDQQRRGRAFDVDAVAAAAGGEHADAELGGGGHLEGGGVQRSGFGKRQDGAPSGAASSCSAASRGDAAAGASAALRRLRNSRASWR